MQNYKKYECYLVQPIVLGGIHKRRRNILGGEGGLKISMLQDIRR